MRNENQKDIAVIDRLLPKANKAELARLAQNLAKARAAGSGPLKAIARSTKVCSKCGIEQPTENFHGDRSKRDGLFAHCKECCRERERARSIRNGRKPRPEPRNEFQRRVRDKAIRESKLCLEDLKTIKANVPQGVKIPGMVRLADGTLVRDGSR